jgi:LysM repeat protein
VQRRSARLLADSGVGALQCIRAVAIATALGFFFPTLSTADSGMATWYGPGFQGNVMYDGQIYNMYDPTTTACNVYPLGTWLQVTNTANGRSVVVQVRDRGDFSHALDLSYAAFKLIADPVLMQIAVSYQVVSGPTGDAVPPRASPSTRAGRPAPATQYVVQSGDTLSGIGQQFGIDPATLASWNGLVDPSLLATGQTLRLTAPSVAPSPPVAPAGSGKIYVVQNGDTIDAIAARFGLSADHLASANGIADPNSLAIGQTIVLPPNVPAGRSQHYVVQAGDTISGIAANFGVTPGSLAAANQLANPDAIQPGLTLTIPSPS